MLFGFIDFVGNRFKGVLFLIILLDKINLFMEQFGR